MSRSVALVSLVAALTLFLAGFGAGRWSPSPAAAKETVTVIEHTTTQTALDLGDKGDTVGDTLTFANDLYDANDVNVVGHDQGSCVRTQPGKAWECSWTNILPDGTIVVQGPDYDTADSVLAITGGTGKYAGAGGEVQVKARDNGTKHEFTFTIG
jgi:allene oxide cyclase